MPLDFEDEDSQNEDRHPFDSGISLTLRHAREENPDDQVRFRRLSELTGIPVESVATDPGSVESEVEFRNGRYSEMFERSPVTGKYLSNYNNAAIAHDDINILEGLEKTFRNFGTTTFAGIAQTFEGFKAKVYSDAADYINRTNEEDVTPGVEQYSQFLNERTNEAIEEIEKLKLVQERFTPEDMNIIQEGIRGGFQSLVEQTPAFAMTLLTRNPNWMLGTIGAQTYFRSYGDARSEGLENDEASWYAMFDSAIEVATERIPLQSLEKILTGKITGNFTRATAEFMLREAGTEQLATLGQSLNAYAFGLDEELENAETPGEIVDIMGRRSAVTFVATVVAGGTQSGIAVGTRKAVEWSLTDEQRQAVRTAREQVILNQMNESARDSRLNQRSPDDFAYFVRELNDGPNTHVYIDPAQAALYLQENQDRIEEDGTLIYLREKLQEAGDNGQDLMIPAEEFMTTVAGSEHFAPLRESMTLNQDSVSPFRREEERVRSQNYVRTLLDEANQNVSEYVEAQEIYNQVREQLIDTGQVQPQAASVMADLVPAWATVFAVRNGISVREVYERAGLKIEGPQTGKTAELKAEGKKRGLFQRMADSVREFITGQGVTETTDPTTPVFDGGVTGQVVMDSVRSNGGITLTRNGEVYQGNTGYVVSVRSMNVDSIETVPALVQATIKNLDGVTRDDMVVGVFDMGDGRYSVDTNVVVQDRDTAVQMGREYDQISIWDLGAEQEIETGGRGEAATEEKFQAFLKQSMAPPQNDDGLDENGELVRPPIVNGMMILDHFSGQANLETLDPNFFGTGIKSQEAARAKERYWTNRTNFGIRTGEPGGYRKERALGPNFYQVEVPADQMYDIDADPENILENIPRPAAIGEPYDPNAPKRDKADPETNSERRNLFESRIKEAGYSGYWQKHPSHGLVAVTFDAQPVLPRTTGVYRQPPTFEHEAKNQKEFGAFLNRMFEQQWGGPLTEQTPENLKLIANQMVDELVDEIGADSAAADWYKDSINHALGHAAEIHPEIASDENMRQVFIMSLALTSNGATVARNVENAEAVYANWKETGVFDTNAGGGYGTRQSGIQKGFDKFAELIENLGLEGTFEFLNGRFTVRELKKAGYTVSGENMDTEVYGSSIFGPKIGGAFFQNLRGNWDALAMDQWFMKTWGRMTGTMLDKKGELRGAPQNGKERNWIRQVMSEAQVMLSDRGYDVDIAAMQALLWYREKDLYTQNNVADKKAEATDYEQELEKLANRKLNRRASIAGERSGAREARLTAKERAEIRRAGKPRELSQRSRQREDDGSLKGLPRNVGKFTAKVNEKATAVAESYMASRGLRYTPPSEYVKVNQERAERIAEAYENMQHDPSDPEVAAAYEALVEETIEQYKAIIDAGLTVEFIQPGQNDPYSESPRQMTQDVEKNDHMWVFSTREGFGSDQSFDPAGNPLLEETEFEISGQKALVNDLFRVVHDYFGHVKEGVGFRADGEENAWRSHASMYTPLARKAMTTETRGQNSWVNYGPHGEKNRTASPDETHFADQKIGLLPQWVVTEGSGQTYKQGRDRGSYDTESVTIRLTEASDLSTFLHEFAHFMYDQEMKYDGAMLNSINEWFGRNAARIAFEASTYLDERGIYEYPTREQVEQFIAGESTGNLDMDEEIQRAMHEQFARGFETYLMEGRAPSVEMRGVFATFARWLERVYNNIRGNLNVEVDQEMREVFDRMLATDEQIQMAKAREKYAPLFTDATMAGMTEQQYAEYQQQQQEADDRAHETLRTKLIRQLRRQTKRWWKQERQDIIDEQMKSLQDERVYRAGERLRNGDIKLDRAAVREMFGEEATSKKGTIFTKIPSKLSGMTATGGTGVHPDEAAAMFGYNSGAEMVEDILHAKPIKAEAEARAEEEMVRRHGDMLKDGTIEAEADRAIKNEKHAKLLLTELRALSRGTAVPNIDRAVIKAIATEQIGKLSFRQIDVRRYRKAEIRAAQEAAVALSEGNKEAAAEAKLRQITNFYLGQEAQRARDGITKIVDNMGRYSTKSVQTQIMKAGNEYWEQLERILSRFEFRKSRSLASVSALNTWVRERIEQDGDDIELTAEVLNETYATHWKNIPYSTMQGIRDSVANLEHAARFSNKITLMGEAIDFDTLVSNWTGHMESKNVTRFSAQRTTVVEGRKWGAWAMAQMTKIPWMASWLDGGSRVGMTHQILVQPFVDAQNAEFGLQRQALTPVVDAMNNRSKADIRRHNTKIHIPEIKNDKNDGNLFGHQILAVALNTGNLSNLRKLLLGEGWAQPENESEITFENPKLQAVLKHMTKSDWDLVQLIWDQMDSLYPQLADVKRRASGITPPKIEATPISNKFGEYRGGYYPVKYDAHRSQRAAMNEERLMNNTESMFSTDGSIHAAVTASATNERTGFYDPIRLSLDIVPNHFQETIHYITHHDAVRQVNKLIRDTRVAKVIKEKLGPEEYAQLKPWLNDIAKDGMERPSKTFIDDIFGRLRFGITLGLMGFKATTGIIQVSGLFNTMAEVGFMDTAKVLPEVGKAVFVRALRKVTGSPQSMDDALTFAMENSKVLPHRVKTMDRELKKVFNDINDPKSQIAKEGGAEILRKISRGLSPKWARAVQEASMKHIAYIQLYTVDLPSWHAAYEKKLGETGSEKEAFQYADWVVEQMQGSGSTKDLAQVLRGQTETHRAFTMFMTFFSSLWNAQRDTARGARSGIYSTTGVAAKLMFMISLPVIFEMIMRGQLWDDEDEELDLEKLALNTAMFPVQSVPFFRDVVSGAFSGYGYNVSPAASMMERGIQGARGLVENILTDDDITRAQAENTSKLVGAFLGTPGMAQAWATGEHLYQVLEDGEEFTVREFLFGPDPE